MLQAIACLSHERVCCEKESGNLEIIVATLSHSLSRNILMVGGEKVLNAGVSHLHMTCGTERMSQYFMDERLLYLLKSTDIFSPYIRYQIQGQTKFPFLEPLHPETRSSER